MGAPEMKVRLSSGHISTRRSWRDGDCTVSASRILGRMLKSWREIALPLASRDRAHASS